MVHARALGRAAAMCGLVWALGCTPGGGGDGAAPDAGGASDTMPPGDDGVVTGPDGRAPDAEVEGPDAEVEGPDAEVEGPDAEVEGPDAEVEGPDAEAECVDGDEVSCGLDVGACRPGRQVCAGGVFGPCEGAVGPVAETCDEADEDCDGAIDEGLDCQCADGDTRPCGDDTGECQAGVQRCEDGSWLGCEGAIGGSPERCDAADNDCDGAVDETLGQTECGVGACRVVVDNCVDGVARACAPDVARASDEVCNGLDDDCDGGADERLSETVQCGVGRCFREVETCAAGVPAVCAPGEPVDELCNGEDDDCDGSADEGLDAPVTCGVGACAREVAGCVDGVATPCAPGEPGAEQCSGVDEDCDGAVDEGQAVDVSCGEGICARTVSSCVDGEAVECEPGRPGVEGCNGLDDDCDGAVDEQLDGAIVCGLGLCAAEGVRRCVDGAWVEACEPGMPDPGAVELCDGLDRDCDGRAGEGVTELSRCGFGLCNHEVRRTCVDGAWDMDCAPADAALPEACNSRDDDCDGRIDEEGACWTFDRVGDFRRAVDDIALVTKGVDEPFVDILVASDDGWIAGRTEHGPWSVSNSGVFRGRINLVRSRGLDVGFSGAVPAEEQFVGVTERARLGFIQVAQGFRPGSAGMRAALGPGAGNVFVLQTPQGPRMHTGNDVDRPLQVFGPDVDIGSLDSSVADGDHYFAWAGANAGGGWTLTVRAWLDPELQVDWEMPAGPAFDFGMRGSNATAVVENGDAVRVVDLGLQFGSVFDEFDLPGRLGGMSHGGDALCLLRDGPDGPEVHVALERDNWIPRKVARGRLCQIDSGPDGVYLAFVDPDDRVILARPAAAEALQCATPAFGRIAGVGGRLDLHLPRAEAPSDGACVRGDPGYDAAVGLYVDVRSQVTVATRTLEGDSAPATWLRNLCDQRGSELVCVDAPAEGDGGLEAELFPGDYALWISASAPGNVIDVTIEPVAAPGSCAAPTEVVDIGRHPASTRLGVDEVEGTCGGGGPEAVFRFVAPEPGSYCVDTFGSDIDTVMWILEGDCDGPELGCNDDAGRDLPGGNLRSRLTLDAVDGGVYTIVVDGFGARTGPVMLNIEHGACESPIELP